MICCDDMRMAVADNVIERNGPRGTVFKAVHITRSPLGAVVSRQARVQIAFCPWCRAPQPSNMPVSPLPFPL